MFITESYKKYMRSPEWARKRQEVFRYYGRKCYACKKYKKVLQVHHRSYRHLGNEPLVDLIPLCIPCHKTVTAYHRKHRRAGIEKNTAIVIKLIQRNL